eukprot:GHVU01185653.1.p1 GENE.GHVU01185653.1~~GHVU01185653.1.p1  ORF type:complete len:127 (+),score=6.38 GHVU01185653.1:297-677(+)
MYTCRLRIAHCPTVGDEERSINPAWTGYSPRKTSFSVAFVKTIIGKRKRPSGNENRSRHEEKVAASAKVLASKERLDSLWSWPSDNEPALEIGVTVLPGTGRTVESAHKPSSLEKSKRANHCEGPG